MKNPPKIFFIFAVVACAHRFGSFARFGNSMKVIDVAKESA